MATYKISALAGLIFMDFAVEPNAEQDILAALGMGGLEREEYYEDFFADLEGREVLGKEAKRPTLERVLIRLELLAADVNSLEHFFATRAECTAASGVFGCPEFTATGRWILNLCSPQKSRIHEPIRESCRVLLHVVNYLHF